LLADEIAGHRAGDQQDQQGQQDAETRHMEAQQLVRPPLHRQDLQRLVERADDPVEHRDGDGHRHDDQQAREDPFAQGSHGALQWQAQPPPQPPDAAGAASDLAGALSAGLDSVLAGAPSALGAGAEVEGAPEAPPRKSVTYQPEPLSWKPAA
ncbi:hypothetical protein KXW64_008668, partial [Aspergillus fumigatus]